MKIYPCFVVAIILLLVACKPSTTVTKSTNKTAKRVHKGEEEFNAYLERKRSKFKDTAVPSCIINGIDGETYNPANMKGKIIVLNFWFAACQPCITEIPSLNELQRKFKTQEVLVLSVSTDSKTVATQTAKNKKMDYWVGYDGKVFAEQLEVTSYPTTFLIDANGIIREVFIGSSSFDATQTYIEIKPHIDQLLQK